MNSRFQEIISTPAIIVPSMTTEEIQIALLEASLAYVKKSISLDTLTLLASKIQHFMGMRGEDNTKVENILSEIVSYTSTPKKGFVY